MKIKVLVAGLLVALVLVLLPLSAAAVSNPDFMVIFNAHIAAILGAAKLAYCIAGWTVVC